VKGAFAAILMAASICGRELAFEVASVRQHTGPLTRQMSLTISGPRVTLEGYSILQLVMEAYQPRGAYQVAADSIRQPDIREEYYDIAARAPGERAPSGDELRKMIQALLRERFHAVVHREPKEMQVYALVAAKDGPKLKASQTGEACSRHTALAGDGQNYNVTFSACGMEALAESLGNLGLDRPVIDKTGLTGRYDFHLLATPEFRREGDTTAVSIFTAIRELGLRLEPQKAPLDVIVIDHVEKPTEN
jgi:uncharacterized protein (TIGR03435 family)